MHMHMRRHCLRIAAYSVLWLGFGLLGAVGGSELWLTITVVSFVCVGWLSSVPMRSNVTITEETVTVRNGLRTRRFGRGSLSGVGVKDSYAHLRVVGVRRPVRCWGLPCVGGMLSQAALTLQQTIGESDGASIELYR